MKTERLQPHPTQDRAAAVITAIAELRREVVSLRQVIDDARHPAPVPDWVPGREQDVQPAPLWPAPDTGDDARPHETPATEDAAITAAPAEQITRPEKQRTVTIAGQVVRTPVLTRTPRGKPLAIFPLAVATDNEPVEQHSILAFDARAAKARNSIRRGDQVEVIGYPHPREVPQPDGTTKTMSEVYAVRVIRQTDRKALV